MLFGRERKKKEERNRERRKDDNKKRDTDFRFQKSKYAISSQANQRQQFHALAQCFGLLGTHNRFHWG